ncbi:multidrug efflux pump subunit AcrA (membrane-fusion protein) [Sinorhizobium fredii]
MNDPKSGRSAANDDAIDELGGGQALSPVIAEFQSDAVELEARVPPRIARLTLYGIAALISAAIVWAPISTIDEVVVAPCKLLTTEPTFILHRLETSIIRSIEVTTGEVVRAAKAPVTLDGAFSQSDFDQQREKFIVLDAQVRRIEAELDDADYTAIASLLRSKPARTTKRYSLIAKEPKHDRKRSRDALQECDGFAHKFPELTDARLDVDASLPQVRGKAAEAARLSSRIPSPIDGAARRTARSTRDGL